MSELPAPQPMPFQSVPASHKAEKKKHRGQKRVNIGTTLFILGIVLGFIPPHIGLVFLFIGPLLLISGAYATRKQLLPLIETVSTQDARITELERTKVETEQYCATLRNETEEQCKEMREEAERDCQAKQDETAKHCDTVKAQTEQWRIHQESNSRAELEGLARDTERATAKIETLKLEQKELAAVLRPIRQEVATIDYGLDDIQNPAAEAISLQLELKETEEKIKATATKGKAVSAALPTAAAISAITFASLTRIAKRLALRSYDVEAKAMLTKLTLANYGSSVSRLLRNGEAIERIGRNAEVKLSNEYQELWAKAFSIAYKHLQAKDIAKEIEREKRAELKEAARIERELEQEQKRLEKEKQHYLNVIAVVERAGKEDEAAELHEKIVEVEKSLNDIDFRKANIRAGYVYVISNIGSFGERMVKIGMTRRLRPIERVQELSDASVPYNFDIHALFFSEDAVGVETELHHKFADRRVNLVNKRREFFAVTPAEVRDALKDIAGNLVEFTEEPEATQFRQTLAMRRAGGKDTDGLGGVAPESV